MSAPGGAADSEPGGAEPVGALRFDLAVTVERPPDEVFAFLADVQRAVTPGSGVRMTKTPQGPTVPGTMWHERVRLAPGCWMHIDSVATDVEPPRRLGMNFCSRYFSGHLNYDVTATEEGSVLRQRQILVPRRLLQRAGPWIQQRLGPRLQVRLRDIKSLLEAQPPNPAR